MLRALAQKSESQNALEAYEWTMGRAMRPPPLGEAHCLGREPKAVCWLMAADRSTRIWRSVGNVGNAVVGFTEP